MVNSGFARKINIFCLLAAIIAVLLLPLKKEIWYDETVTILCSKGISHDSPTLFANTTTTSSETIARLNTARNVFDATVVDNGNSYFYNIGLHYFTGLFGNSIFICMLFSKLCSIGTLIAFFFLCSLVFEHNIFTSLAILLLAADNTFMEMSHEIRAYPMGIFFVTLAAIYFYKFMYEQEKPRYLLLLGLFSVGAGLSHFLSVYIILVFLAGLLMTKRMSLFSVKNLLAMAIPIGIVVVFFCFSYTGLQQMNKQNQGIQQKLLYQGFSLTEVLLRSMKYTAINFKAVFPAILNNAFTGIGSFLFVGLLYVTGRRSTADHEVRRNLNVLFILGLSSTFFLAFLSIKSRHYTALYFRYYSFCIPFTCLFTAYLLSVIFRNPKIKSLISWGLLLIIVVPVLALSFAANIKSKPRMRYNYDLVAHEVMREGVIKIEVPEWRDAFLFQSLLPEGYKIDYVVNPASLYFTLYKANTEEKVLAIKDNS